MRLEASASHGPLGRIDPRWALLATIACLPVVFAGSVAVTATGAWLGMKESWI